jgi:hypothetical protein
MRPPSRSRRRTRTFAPQFLQVALCPGVVGHLPSSPSWARLAGGRLTRLPPPRQAWCGASPAARLARTAAAADRYLDSIKTTTTRSSYADTLARLVSRASGRDTASLLPEDYAAVMDRWDDAAAATWNRHLSALTSFTAWAGRQEILTANPARRLERRKPACRSDRAISQVVRRMPA